jgi:hypothetical protein
MNAPQLRAVGTGTTPSSGGAGQSSGSRCTRVLTPAAGYGWLDVIISNGTFDPFADFGKVDSLYRARPSAQRAEVQELASGPDHLTAEHSALRCKDAKTA